LVRFSGVLPHEFCGTENVKFLQTRRISDSSSGITRHLFGIEHGADERVDDLVAISLDRIKLNLWNQIEALSLEKNQEMRI
jgi:hypothetical protein